MPINTTYNTDASINTNTATINTSDEERVYTCPHCDRTFTSHIGLVGHLRIHRTETGEPVPGVPTYTHRILLHSPHCTRTFIHRKGQLGHMRVHENLRWTIAGCSTPSHPPSSASHRTPTSPTSSTQLPPLTQVGSVRPGSFSRRRP
ncbi:hypothetical protein SprV_0100114800 [Sparganum proliferum]